MPAWVRHTDARVESAASVLDRLDREAGELDWAGDHDAADRRRKEAKRIRDSGDLWLPNF